MGADLTGCRVYGISAWDLKLDEKTKQENLIVTPRGQPETQVAALCQELGITRQTLYRHVGPAGELRADGRKLLARRGR